MIVYPGITEKSIRNVLDRVALFGNAVDGFHFDFADGKYVDNILVELDEVGELPNYFFEAHLMVTSPEKYFEKCAKYGFKRVIGHIDALKEQSDEYILSLQEKVHQLGMEFGLALKKDNAISSDVVCKVDYILIMTIVPGFTGQPFLPEQLNMITQIRGMCPTVVIGVDGHIDPTTASATIAAGANVLVSTTFLSGDDVLEKYQQLKGISYGN